jgi:hypothetical protein
MGVPLAWSARAIRSAGQLPYGGFRWPRVLHFRTLTQADFDAIALELNERPRQTLGYRSPSQALAEVLR